MKNKKLIGSLIVISLVLMFFVTAVNSNGLIENNLPKTSQEELIDIDFSINIKGNWSEYVDKYSWCSGNGTEESPYIIEGIHVTNENLSAHISIETAEHFIIRNCVVSNYSAKYGHYTFSGIYIEKGEYGLIENCTIINCSTGISMFEAKDDIRITNCNFIGSHDNNITGMGAAIRIQEAKGVYITYNNIYGFYDGVIIRDSEEVYIENNRIETLFEHISDTGVYLYGVNDSSIIDNEFYGCKIDGHDYDISISGIKGLATSNLENCFNITILNNRFYDIEGNLLYGSEPDEQDEPDEPDDLIVEPNYWIFSLVFLMGFICVCLFLYFFKKYKRKGD